MRRAHVQLLDSWIPRHAFKPGANHLPHCDIHDHRGPDTLYHTGYLEPPWPCRDGPAGVIVRAVGDSLDAGDDLIVVQRCGELRLARNAATRTMTATGRVAVKHMPSPPRRTPNRPPLT